MVRCGLDSSGSGWGAGAGCCDIVMKEPSGSIKGREFLG